MAALRKRDCRHNLTCSHSVAPLNSPPRSSLNLPSLHTLSALANTSSQTGPYLRLDPDEKSLSVLTKHPSSMPRASTMEKKQIKIRSGATRRQRVGAADVAPQTIFQE